MPDCVYQTIIGVMDGLPQVMPPLIAEDTQCNVASQHDANHPRPYWQAHRVKSHQIKANRLVASESYHFCPRQAPFSSPQGLVLHLFSCRSPGSDAARQHNTGSIVVQAGREHEEVDFETEVEVEGLVWMPVLQADAARQCITGLIIPEVDRSATAGQEKEPLDISSNSQGAIQKDIGMEHVQSPFRKKDWWYRTTIRSILELSLHHVMLWHTEQWAGHWCRPSLHTPTHTIAYHPSDLNFNTINELVLAEWTQGNNTAILSHKVDNLAGSVLFCNLLEREQHLRNICMKTHECSVSNICCPLGVCLPAVLIQGRKQKLLG